MKVTIDVLGEEDGEDGIRRRIDGHCLNQAWRSWTCFVLRFPFVHSRTDVSCSGASFTLALPLSWSAPVRVGGPAPMDVASWPNDLLGP